MSILGTVHPEDCIDAPGEELLSFEEVCAVPGVMQTGDIDFPKPTLDLRKAAYRMKGYKPTEYVFWVLSDILLWLHDLQERGLVRRSA